MKKGKIIFTSWPGKNKEKREGGYPGIGNLD
jgi:hypothetical protein